jgi:tetratricopeptide (TPR) repeat protein
MTNNRLNQLKDLLQNSPEDSFLLFALAIEYYKQNQLTEAEDHFNKLLKTDPGYVGQYYHYGKLLVETGRLDLALNIYDEGIAIAKAQKDFHAVSELMNARNNAMILD